MRNLVLLAIAFFLTLSSCKKEEFNAYSGLGKVPVYLPISQLDDIRSEPARRVEQSGPIFLIGDFFFMTERGKGIHVFDISDADQQNSLVFIKIPAVTDFTIDGNFLYADSWKDLVTLDISDIYNVAFLSRIKGVFDPFPFPQFYNGPFRCVEEAKGAVIGWEVEYLDAALCHTLN